MGKMLVLLTMGFFMCSPNFFRQPEARGSSIAAEVLHQLKSFLRRFLATPDSIKSYNQWIGLRENLQETMVFAIKYRAFL
jgi:hypothetical protein